MIVINRSVIKHFSSVDIFSLLPSLNVVNCRHIMDSPMDQYSCFHGSSQIPSNPSSPHFTSYSIRVCTHCHGKQDVVENCLLLLFSAIFISNHQSSFCLNSAVLSLFGCYINIKYLFHPEIRFILNESGSKISIL